jgi:hypothetical protein
MSLKKNQDLSMMGGENHQWTEPEDRVIQPPSDSFIIEKYCQ